MRLFDNTPDGLFPRWSRPFMAVLMVFLVAISTVPLLHCQTLVPIRHGNNALAPWENVGSNPIIVLNNQGQDSIVVLAQAPSVDNAIRLVAVVPPFTAITVKLPYADGDVYLRLALWQSAITKVPEPRRGATDTLYIHRLQQ